MLASAFAGYVGFLILGTISVIVGVVALFLSHVLGPSKPTRSKGLPYECGVDPIQKSARERYSIHFYLVAILFILFDLETVFLFPWAATVKNGVAAGEAGDMIRMVMLVEVLLFVLVLGAGLFYVWKRRGLEWD